MDYSLCHALQNTNLGDLCNIVVLYDVNCQFQVNFRKRVQASKWMTYPNDKRTYFGIGAFHVSGHLPRCFPRHSPQFIPGSGIVDGEILETLWAVLNEVSPSTHTATLAARTEMLDDHMLDLNWKKLIGIGMAWLSTIHLIHLSIFQCQIFAKNIKLLSLRLTTARNTSRN
jgi:hypothetical protein